MLWAALERAIPDVRDRAELVLTGSPLTHERYLSRHKVRAAEFWPATPGLLLEGPLDGIPVAAATRKAVGAAIVAEAS